MGRQYSRRFLVDACTVYRLVLMHLEPDSSDRINKQETSEKRQRTGYLIKLGFRSLRRRALMQFRVHASGYCPSIIAMQKVPM